MVVPAVPDPNLGWRIKLGMPLQLRTPTGHFIDTRIAGVEILCGPKVKDRIAFLLPTDIARQDVPAGTEIWLLENAGG